ncbi:hypothetical protein DMH17_15020 [Raoultella planticola]|nr:hypothetical protein [Raoultella planticola]
MIITAKHRPESLMFCRRFHADSSDGEDAALRWQKMARLRRKPDDRMKVGWSANQLFFFILRITQSRSRSPLEYL